MLGLVLVLGAFLVLFSIRGELGKFVSLGNAQVLIHGHTYLAVAALGMLVIIISGGIDLSTGSVVALVTVATMQVYRGLFSRYGAAGSASVVAIAAGIGVGGLCGCINGLVITRLRVIPFVVTLGMLSIARGAALWLADRQTLNFPVGGRPDWVAALSVVGSRTFVFEPGFWIMLALAVALGVTLHRTVLGRYCYAIGSNEATTRLCGVRVERYKVVFYTLGGLFAGVAGVLLFAQVGGDPNCAQALELQVIAAVVIGGASLTGGRGTVVGTLIGVLILAILKNGVDNFNVAVELQ
ncbi:MAG TPA: ABC transporter permease, partial [Gemmataceae bacterium]|nr:ABC transporter permease [Gemmataceae bacterium]